MSLVAVLSPWRQEVGKDSGSGAPSRGCDQPPAPRGPGAAPCAPGRGAVCPLGTAWGSSFPVNPHYLPGAGPCSAEQASCQPDTVSGALGHATPGPRSGRRRAGPILPPGSSSRVHTATSRGPCDITLISGKRAARRLARAGGREGKPGAAGPVCSYPHWSAYARPLTTLSTQTGYFS